MKKSIITLSMASCAMAMLALSACGDKSDRTPVDYSSLVNPFIGTDYTGNTYPGAQAPFGMVQLSPDNGLPGWDRIAGYFYPDSTIAGFSHTHLSGTGAGDLYDISFLPVTIPYNESEPPLGIHSRFSHDTEEASAGYYAVTLDDYKIRVELTASERTGLQRYTFPGGDAAVFLNLRKAMNWDATVDTRIHVVDSVTVAGYRFSAGWARDQRLYFCARFSRPWDSMTIDSTAVLDADDGSPTGGIATVARFNFSTTPGEQIVIATAISAVDEQGAMANLAAEAPVADFDRVLADTKAKWNNELGRIDIETPVADDKVNFYTALYHSMLAPTIYGDVDGRYRGPDKEIHKADGWTNYSTFSLWDTYRAAHPLYTIVQPERVPDMINSFLSFYDQNGRLPVWNFQGGETDMMIGYHSVPVIVDAYLKGIGGFDARKALEACVATANIDDYRGIGTYKSKGYVPYDVEDPYNADDWSLSRTLEYAFDDYCIAQMARKMGEDKIADEFMERSRNYRNVFDPASRFMVPRDSQGRWQPDFSPDDYTAHICESNGWHYLWSVQHDIPALVEMMGGPEPFAARLDSMFTYTPAGDDELPIFSTGMIGQYAHGNEPSHHVIYLHNVVDRPWLTASYVRQVMDKLYRNEPAGLCGNEDCGQMSAWYVFSALGFYPVNPVAGEYEIGAPRFPSATISLPGGKTFTVSAPAVSDKNIYIASATLDGEPLHSSKISHERIMQGGELRLEMTSDPNVVWYHADK